MLNSVFVRGVGTLRAAHLGPTLLVVTASFLLALSVFPLVGAFEIAVAIFAGQLIVGWSNDVIDFSLDNAAHRMKKPLVAGTISIKFLKRCIAVTTILAFLLSLTSPLETQGTLLHFLGILSATTYNLKLKSTVFSPFPYMISFGILPWAIYLSAGKIPPLWLWLGFIFFSTAFHFLNVLKDLKLDLDQGVHGLPQQLGRNNSIAVAISLVIIGILILTFFR